MKKWIFAVIGIVILIFTVYLISDFYMTEDSLATNVVGESTNSYSREDFYTEYLDLTLNNDNSGDNEDTGADGNTDAILSSSVIQSSNGTSNNGGVAIAGKLEIPAPNELVECVEINTQKKYNVARVAKDSYAMEFSYGYAKSKYKTISKRIDNFIKVASSSNAGNDDQLLTITVDGNPCYIGAMVDKFCSPGDIVLCTLNNGTTFYMAIVDVKSLEDKKGATNQIDSVYGHGYLEDNKTKVKMCICEFLDASNGKLKYSSATKYNNGKFLDGTYVTKAELVKHFDIR